MCGRFTLHQSSAAIVQTFALEEAPDWEVSYNIAPTQAVPAILQSADSKRLFKRLRWGLIPSWSKETSIGARLINARAETVAEKPAFRSALRHRRCLIVADGFYEWQQKNGSKQPFYIHLKNQALFAFAGLWERWQGQGDDAIESCTILTTEPNSLMQTLHDRMPVILHPEDYNTWLNPDIQQLQDLQPLLRPYPTEELSAYPVSSWVNRPTHNSEQCIQQLTASEPAE
jgi:putative SOS response-associated peptidase YedK